MNIQERLEIVRNSPERAMTLIYMWLKQDVINYKEFKALVEAYYVH